MELKLNIYNELDEIVKTYTRNTYSIRMRQLKDIITTFDVDRMSGLLKDEAKNTDLIDYVFKFVTNSYEKVQELMQDIFTELTEEEYLDTHLDEVVKVLSNLVKYTFSTIGLAGKKGKN